MSPTDFPITHIYIIKFHDWSGSLPPSSENLANSVQNDIYYFYDKFISLYEKRLRPR